MSTRQINVALIGQKFMGRAHSNAYLQSPRFFNLPIQPVLHTIIARDLPSLQEFAKRWGWANATTDWQAAVNDPAIDLVDVTTPNNKHREFVIAALAAGKHVACEKPLAATLSDAREMRDAAVRAKAKGVKTFVWYNYRRVPAVATAYQLARQGVLGRIYQARAFYCQGWASSPEIPLIWRFDKDQAGSGSLGDLGAHVIDMVRFVTGDEISEITGAISHTFIKERALPGEGGGAGIAAGAKASGKMGKVTVDDAVLAIGTMSEGSIFSLESTRFATGRENKNGIEINGEKGSLYFNFEDLNNLYFFDATVSRQVQGWTKIQASVPGTHPYQHAYWPTAHPGGYEHAFVNQAADMLRVLGGEEPEVPLPDFEDAYKTQVVLEAIERAAAARQPVALSEIG
ncbi:MAG TPA: Gfo/Idh/MocA family oxidoreductase [Tepidisphaeraceae bacterium]|jgi:predicted dehydrogenase